MGGPTVKGRPNFALLLAPKTHLTHLGKGREDTIVDGGDFFAWGLEVGEEDAESPCGGYLRFGSKCANSLEVYLPLKRIEVETHDIGLIH